MNKIIPFLISLFLSITFSKTEAEIRLPAIIGNHMVLQQKTEVRLWGWCDPNEKISIKPGWNNQIDSTKGNSDGKWMITLTTPAAGGPYTINIEGSNKIVLEDVLIGEVWLCSGQSNMEMSYSWGIKQYTQDIESANNKSIRLFHIPRLTAQYPQDDTKGEWVVCNPKDLETFSLAGYFFGQKLQQTLSLPVGLIESTWGGTPAEVWTPYPVILNNPVLKQAADNLTEIPWGPIRPAATYNAMISPITNYAIRGVIWYQGEANVSAASTYRELFSSMITSWRTAWKEDFPFYFVQIAPFSGYGKNISGALLQEAQTQTATLPNTGVIVINDLVDDLANIHPKNKKDVGLRLANYALAETYGQTTFAYKNPSFKEMKVEKDKLRIYFNNAKNGLLTKNGAPTDFYIAGPDEVFKPATARVEGNTVLVWSDEVKNPVAVRYGFTNSSTPNLFSKEELPVNTFRTDRWDHVNTKNQ